MELVVALQLESPATKVIALFDIVRLSEAVAESQSPSPHQTRGTENAWVEREGDINQKAIEKDPFVFAELLGMEATSRVPSKSIPPCGLELAVDIALSVNDVVSSVFETTSISEPSFIGHHATRPGCSDGKVVTESIEIFEPCTNATSSIIMLGSDKAAKVIVGYWLYGLKKLETDCDFQVVPLAAVERFVRPVFKTAPGMKTAIFDEDACCLQTSELRSLVCKVTILGDTVEPTATEMKLELHGTPAA